MAISDYRSLLLKKASPPVSAATASTFNCVIPMLKSTPLGSDRRHRDLFGGEALIDIHEAMHQSHIDIDDARNCMSWGAAYIEAPPIASVAHQVAQACRA